MKTLTNFLLSAFLFLLPFALMGQPILNNPLKGENDTIPTHKELSEFIITAQRTATEKFFSPNAIDVLAANHLAQYQA